MSDRRKINVLGGPLKTCSSDPMTGFFRDGTCFCGPSDPGLHAVCAVMTEEFLEYSQQVGNDLSTPRPEYHFPGLKPGDKWCLCAGRWEQARQAGRAPKVDLAATSYEALAVCDLNDLKAHAAETGA